MQWRDELNRVDGSKLSEEARGELQELKDAVTRNLAQLDTEAGVVAQVVPWAPFAPKIVDVLDAYRRLDDMDAQQSAAALSEITRQIAAARESIEPGQIAVGRISSDELAGRAADTVDALAGELRGWYNFYDAYDPTFSWWMPAPYEELTAAMTQYSTSLRQTAAPAAAAQPAPAAASVSVQPAPAPPVSYVPDLNRLLATPQNEFRGVMQAYSGGGGRGGRGGGGRGGRGGARGAEYYDQWLAALKTLDFDSLSRPAQVSYLGLRYQLENAKWRMTVPRQENIPSKLDQDTSGLEVQSPVGRTALWIELRDNWIPYTQEETIAIGDAEYQWCVNEFIRASRELGYGDEWAKVVEHAKTLHAPPGGQPTVIRKMMHAAVDFMRERDLLSVPQVEVETLRMNMMSPQRQLVNPFFTGGGSISVSYPTNTMPHAAKLQSMRGNNIPFALATVHHEMIPGHNMTGFMGGRYSAYRAGGAGGGPFYGEGWAVYWEMTFYRLGYPQYAKDKGFATDSEPANRLGFLFWRAFRGARITFSLRYQMGEWAPDQCIDFLIRGVGHEPENARAEVLRSFQGSYGPLYQAAYLLGAVQLRMLHKEVVEAGKMSERDFHDTIIESGGMPIAQLRLLVNGEKLSPDMNLDWKFYGNTIPALPPDLM
jgi:hypothetical protein